jgi:hypothetical protein
MRQRICFVMLLLLVVRSDVHAQEQVSTWPFAERIGWRGVQFQFGVLRPFKAQRYQNDMFVRLAKPEEKTGISKDLESAFENAFAARTTVGLRLSAIFLPFRKSENSWLKKSEWQTGLEYTGTYASIRLTYGGRFNHANGTYGSYEAVNNSLYWFNNWQLERKLFFNNVKIYAGPGFAFTLIPAYHFYYDGYKTNIYSGKEPINHGKFGFNFNAMAGIKISLGCRVNLHVEYQFYNQNWVMERDFLSQSMGGYAFGLRYKFNKPEGGRVTPENPVLW